MVTRRSARAWLNAAELGLSAIHHRGPDDTGLVCLPEQGEAGLRIVLGNARLAVVDVSPLGHMPMPSGDRLTWLTYNGEIYNHRELRLELERAGPPFRSSGDTEVLLRAYEAWGDSFLERLNGMFALAIADYRAPRPRFLLARDRLGIKPCYYTIHGDELVFGSELKSLRAAGALPLDIDWHAIADYFTYLFIPGPRTAYSGVQQLAPGHSLVWELPDPEPRLRRYWSPLPSQVSRAGASSVGVEVETLRALVRDSVKRELISDVPLGVFLSGGIDSTILTALAAEETDGKLKTFTVAFRGPGIATIDDRAHARRVSERYGTDHHELSIDLRDPEELLALGSMFDQPFGNPTYYLSYLISRKTREHVTVALSGAGADELFGGYPRYRAIGIARPLARVPPAVAAGARALVGRWREDYDDALPRRMKLLLRGAGVRFPEQYVRWTYYFSDLEKEQLLAPLIERGIELPPAVRVIEDLLNAAGSLGDLGSRVQYADLMTFLADNVLEYTDRSSMAVSLEVRVPFLDHRVVEYALRLPFSYKVRGRTMKWILRRAFADLIPAENARAPKRGFSPPLAMWMDSTLDRYFETELTEARVRQVGVLSWPYIQRLRAEQRARVNDNSMKLFGLIMFDQWWKSVQGRG